jgi:iron-sulfur cluster repair protein YtfE (RIC family)
MNAIDMLKKDHRKVDALFEAFEATPPGDLEARRSVVKQIIHALRTHTAIEEDVFYPEVESRVAGAVKADVREAAEEHLQITRLLNDLAIMDPAHVQYAAKVHVLKEEVQHHVKEEEEGMFPHVRAKLGATALKEVAEALVEDREFVDRQVSATEAHEGRQAGL